MQDDIFPDASEMSEIKEDKWKRNMLEGKVK